jgi:hypothetical protein
MQITLHEAVHALACARGVKDLSRWQVPQQARVRRLPTELGLAWPQGQRPHPVIGFSEVQLTQQTLAYLGAVICLYRATSSKADSHPGRPQGQAAAWKRTRAWPASQATRSGPALPGAGEACLAAAWLARPVPRG